MATCSMKDASPSGRPSATPKTNLMSFRAALNGASCLVLYHRATKTFYLKTGIITSHGNDHFKK